MAVTEPRRLDLHAAARTALGPEEGDTLMASLPPANTDIATRQDLERHAAATRQDIERVEGSLRQDMERLEGSLRQDIEHLSERIDRHEAATRRDLARHATDTRRELARHATETRKELGAAEGRLQTYIWKVSLGSSAVLAVTIVSLTLGGVALLR
jgi:chromosome segregation ATPase